MQSGGDTTPPLLRQVGRGAYSPLALHASDAPGLNGIKVLYTQRFVGLTLKLYYVIFAVYEKFVV